MGLFSFEIGKQNTVCLMQSVSRFVRFSYGMHKRPGVNSRLGNPPAGLPGQTDAPKSLRPAHLVPSSENQPGPGTERLRAWCGLGVRADFGEVS